LIVKAITQEAIMEASVSSARLESLLRNLDMTSLDDWTDEELLDEATRWEVNPREIAYILRDGDA
jgi:hypothetical protein